MFTSSRDPPKLPARVQRNGTTTSPPSGGEATVLTL